MKKKLKNKNILFLIIVLIFGGFYIFNFTFSYKDISFASGGTQEDFILEYIAGENFATKGFFQLGFLPDYSVDIDNKSNPIFYTHNPPLPSIIQGLLIKIGFGIFSSRIFYSLLSLLGVGLLYLFIAKISSSLIALLSSVFLIINFSGFLALSDHNQYSLGFVIFFGYLFMRRVVSERRYIMIPSLFLLASFTSYMLLAFMIVVEFLYLLFEKDKKLFIFSFIAGFLGGIIHLIQNIITLGLDIAIKDVWLTFTNRFLGFPLRSDLLNFYQENNLVLWDSSVGIPFNSYIRGAIMPFYLFKTPFFLGLVSFVYFWFTRKGNSYKNRNFLIIIFISALLWQFIFSIIIGAYPLVFQFFMAVFLSFITGDLLYLVFKYIRDLNGENFSFKNIVYVFFIMSLIGFSSFKYFTWASGKSKDDSLYQLVDISRRYEGKTFFTNTIPHPISFSTGSWAIGSCSIEGLMNLGYSSCYSKFVDFDNVNSFIPDYILLSSYSFSFDCPSDCFLEIKNKLSSKYTMIEDVGTDIVYKIK